MKEQHWTKTSVRQDALRIAVIIAATTLFAGCAQLKPQAEEPSDQDQAQPTSATAADAGSEQDASETPAASSEPPLANIPLEPDLLYNILLGEVAAQREDVETSLDAFKEAALESRDPRLIGRATRLAIASGNYESALETATIWAEVRPDANTPREALAIIHLAREDVPAASQVFETIIDAADPDVGTSYRRVADIMSRQEDKNSMVGLLEKLVEKNPDDPDAWYSLAFLADRADRDELASAAIDRAIELRPGWEDAALSKAGYLLQSEKIDEYGEYAEQFLREFPDANQFRVSYARALVDQDRTEDALDQFKRVVKNDPENADAAYAIGILSLQEEIYDDAAEYFEQTLALRPDNDQARLYLGQVATETEDWQAAERWYREVVSDAYRLEAQRLLGLLKADQGDTDGAIQHLSSLAPANDEERVQIYLTKEQVLREANQYEDAKALLDEALVVFPDNGDLLYARALVAAQLSLIDVHEADLRKLILNEPENAHAYNALGYTLADQTDRFNEALQLVEKALELRPEDPFIIDSMGWVQYRLGNLDAALEYLTKAHETRADAEIAAHLGEVLWSTGNRREAKGIWKKALKDAPENKVLLETIEKHDAL